MQAAAEGCVIDASGPSAEAGFVLALDHMTAREPKVKSISSLQKLKHSLTGKILGTVIKPIRMVAHGLTPDILTDEL